MKPTLRASHFYLYLTYAHRMHRIQFYIDLDVYYLALLSGVCKYTCLAFLELTGAFRQQIR